MTIFQKAIKVRKVCENRISCEGCNYSEKCKHTNTFFFIPKVLNIETVAQVIQKEKWKVK